VNVVNFVNLLRDVRDEPVIVPLFLRSHEKLIESKGITRTAVSVERWRGPLGKFTTFTTFISGLRNPAPMNCPIHRILLVC
jgi:hypothetical protein